METGEQSLCKKAVLIFCRLINFAEVGN